MSEETQAPPPADKHGTTGQRIRYWLPHAPAWSKLGWYDRRKVQEFVATLVERSK